MSRDIHIRHTTLGWRYDAYRLDRYEEKTETGSRAGYTKIKVGEDVVDFEIVVDVDKLIRMVGHKANSSRKGVTKLQRGAVVVSVSNRVRRPLAKEKQS